MNSQTSSGRSQAFFRSPLIVLALVLTAIFSVLFWRNFQPGVAHFANDGPIGTLLAAPYDVPDAYQGIWNDLLWLGAWNGNFNPNLTGLAIGALGPTLYHKFMIPIGLIFLGMSAAVCFLRFGLPRWVCVLGGIAAALNMNPFSNACWGLPSRAHAMGAAFLALAALHSSFGRFSILKSVLAGLAIGLGISEGGDNGAIFAIVVGFYAFYRALVGQGSLPARVGRGMGRVAITAVVAALFAAQTLNIFVNTAVKGVVGMSDDRLTPEQKWDFATQGSLHPKETLRVVIAGLYGYRMDAEDGGNYWGRVGESLAAPGKNRHSGAGEHAGVIVVLIALWALHHSLRGRGGAYSDQEREFIWFWGGMAACCLLLAWGKWGPLYRLLYALPYFNTIRLPLKWMHPFHLCLLVLFAYGLAGLGRLYFGKAGSAGRGILGTLKAWWRRATSDERRWAWFSLGLAALSVLGALGYAGNQESLISDLSQANVLGNPSAMAAFSLREVWIFLAFLGLSLGLVLAIISGRFSGKHLGAVAIGSGLLLVTDLVRADRHWMLFFNYHERYAMNPLLHYLQQHSTDYRVAKVPQRPIMLMLQSVAQANPNNVEIRQQLQQEVGLFQHILSYTHEQWQQNQFPYYNIRCLDMSQEPRLPADKAAFNGALAAAASHGHPTREYEMTSTRYFVGRAGHAQILNARLDSGSRRFREGPRYNLVPTRPKSPFFGDLRVQAETNGPFAIIEFDGALPRAKVFTRWEVIPDESQTLARLGAADFDPAGTVLVQDPIPESPAATNAAVSEATITPNRSSHRVEVKVNAPAPGVLLLTDRYDAAWKVAVDGQPALLLRCNYLMRGVQIPAGVHTVAFTYHPAMGGFWIMASCVAVGLCILCFLAVADRKQLGKAE
jgi:hypothetical protein